MQIFLDDRDFKFPPTVWEMSTSVIPCVESTASGDQSIITLTKWTYVPSLVITDIEIPGMREKRERERERDHKHNRSHIPQFKTVNNIKKTFP